jgi:hypothetical protein
LTRRQLIPTILADGRIAQMQLGNGLWVTRDYQTPGTPTTYFIKCILRWVVPSIKGEGYAELFFDHGLVEINVIGKDFYKVVTRDQNDAVESN